MIKAILWDIDGVLVESEPLHVEKIGAVARDPLNKGTYDPVHGVLVKEEDWKELHGIGDHRIHVWLKTKNSNFPLSLDQFLLACEDYYVAHAETLKIRSGAVEAFDIFDAANIPQGAVSSGVRRQVDINLKVAGLERRMVFALSANDVVNTKPHPEPYMKGHERMLALHFNAQANLLLPSECLVIGDSSSDVKSGNAAGQKTAWWKLSTRADDPAASYNVEPEGSNLILLAKKLTNPAFRP